MVSKLGLDSNFRLRMRLLRSSRSLALIVWDDHIITPSRTGRHMDFLSAPHEFPSLQGSSPRAHQHLVVVISKLISDERVCIIMNKGVRLRHSLMEVSFVRMFLMNAQTSDFVRQ